MGFRRRLSILGFLIVGCMIPEVGKDRDGCFRKFSYLKGRISCIASCFFGITRTFRDSNISPVHFDITGGARQVNDVHVL